MLPRTGYGVEGHRDVVDVRLESKSDLGTLAGYVCFSNRPVGVKHFQAIHHRSVDVSHGLALLFGIGTRPFHHGIRGQGGTIFTAALPSVERQVQADMRTHLIHRPARDIFPPRVNLSCQP